MAKVVIISVSVNNQPSNLLIFSGFCAPVTISRFPDIIYLETGNPRQSQTIREKVTESSEASGNRLGQM